MVPQCCLEKREGWAFMSLPSSGLGGAIPALRERFHHVHHVAQIILFGQPFAVVDAKDFHAFMIMEVWEQLGSDEEILGAVGFAGGFNQGVVNSTFGAHIHTLIDLVDQRERRTSFLSQAHEVQNGS